MDIPTDFELEMWEKDANRKIMCTGCYGVGQTHERRTDTWELCTRCHGEGRSEADPHVIRLVAEVRRLRGGDV